MPVNATKMHNICAMLDKRRRCWSNIVQNYVMHLFRLPCLLGRRCTNMHIQYFCVCWGSTSKVIIVDGSPTLIQHWINISCGIKNSRLGLAATFLNYPLVNSGQTQYIEPMNSYNGGHLFATLGQQETRICWTCACLLDIFFIPLFIPLHFALA